LSQKPTRKATSLSIRGQDVNGFAPRPKEDGGQDVNGFAPRPKEDRGQDVNGFAPRPKEHRGQRTEDRGTEDRGQGEVRDSTFDVRRWPPAP